MKRSCLTFLGFICLYSTTFAQNKNDIELGTDIGLNQATVTDGQLTNIAYRVGLDIGVSGEYYFSDRWGIKAKINYDQKGWDNGFINTVNGDYATNYQLNYITIPVMANWHFGRKRNWYLNFGPYIGFLATATETTLGTDLKSDLNSTDAGLAYGIGVKIPLSDNVRFFIEGQGEDGIANIAKGSNSSTLTNLSSSLNVGIVFNPDKKYR